MRRGMDAAFASATVSRSTATRWTMPGLGVTATVSGA